QDELRHAYLAHLYRREDAMWRSCHPDHLTASSLIVSAESTAVLLTLHKKLRRWLQTGGHCEAGDATLSQAAWREASEESGIGGLAIDPEPVLLSRHQVPCGPLRPAHHLDVQFLLRAPRGADPVVSDESEDVQWFNLDALPESVDASVRRLVRCARQRFSASRPQVSSGSVGSPPR